MKNNNFDIIIIGGSFAGMTAGLALAGIDESLRVSIVEKSDIKNHDRKRDGRAYAISSASLEMFAEIGIADVVVKNSGTISDIKITDDKLPFALDFLGREANSENGCLGQIIENYHIHNALRDRILQQKNITLFSPNSYSEISFPEEKSFVKLDDGQVLEARLLLACDGRFSALREHYQIHTTVKNYHQTAIVFNIEHEKPHQNIAHEKFFPGGPLAILPFADQRQSSIVWISEEKLSATILELDEKNFLQQLEKKMEGELGKVKIISEKFSYPLIAIESEKFYHEKILLIGDAACGVHPIAGQGFNLAIAGIKILRDLVRENLFNGMTINGENLIKTYDRKTRFVAKKMLIATDILNSVFKTKSLPIRLLRGFGLGVVAKISPLKKFFIKQAGGF